MVDQWAGERVGYRPGRNDWSPWHHRRVMVCAMTARQTGGMIAITVKWDVKPEYADDFMALIADFTEACRAEPGCLWFEWSRNVDNPHQYVLIEAYRNAAAGVAHVTSGHFVEAMKLQGKYAASRPKMMSFNLPKGGWSELVELEMPEK